MLFGLTRPDSARLGLARLGLARLGLGLARPRSIPTAFHLNFAALTRPRLGLGLGLGLAYPPGKCVAAWTQLILIGPQQSYEWVLLTFHGGMFLTAFGVQIPVVLSATRRIPTMRLPSFHREMKLAAVVDSRV